MKPSNKIQSQTQLKTEKPPFRPAKDDTKPALQDPVTIPLLSFFASKQYCFGCLLLSDLNTSIFVGFWKILVLLLADTEIGPQRDRGSSAAIASFSYPQLKPSKLHSPLLKVNAFFIFFLDSFLFAWIFMDFGLIAWHFDVRQ